MKLIKKVLITTFITGIILTITGIAISGGISGVKEIFYDSKNYEERRVDLDDSTINLNIILDTKELEVNISDNNKSYLIYNHNIKKDTLTKTLTSFDETIQIKRKVFSFPFVDYNLGAFTNETAKLYLSPNQIEKLNINISSGRLNINNINLDKLDVKVSSGSITLRNVKTVNDIYLKSSSGRINLTNVESNNLTIKSSSGGITAKDLKANKIDTNISSGKTNLTNIEAITLIIKSSSGRITLNNNTAQHTTINSNSGSVIITEQRLRDEISFDIKVSSRTITLYGVKYKQVTDTNNVTNTYTITVQSGNVKINS